MVVIIGIIVVVVVVVVVEVVVVVVVVPAEFDYDGRVVRQSSTMMAVVSGVPTYLRSLCSA